MTDNPFFQDWADNPFSLPPFDQIETRHFAPAFDVALKEARAEIDGIADSSEPPDFANVVVALEQSGELLEKVSGVFWNYAGSISDPEIEALQRDLSPKLAAFHSETMLNSRLFQRLNQLWDNQGDLGLDPEQERVLMLYHRMFRRSGAKLEGKEKDRLRKIMERLAELTTEFTQNLLADERTWTLPLSRDDLNGCPDFVIDAALQAATERGQDGFLLTLSRSLVVPFLQFSPRRDLRQKAMQAWTGRGMLAAASDNRPLAAEILKLREERANLLGYPSFADFKLETEMAKTPDQVKNLLMQVWEPAKRQALADQSILEERLVADGFPLPLEQWDWRYYAEQRRKAEHDLDEAEIKPYFRLDQMIEAAFDCASRLFGLSFRPLDIPLYHPDARAFDVTKHGKHLAVFIGDYFARPSKRSGAWCSRFREQHKLQGGRQPIVVNVCNFSKAPEGKASLLNFDDARTLFHEFGHALHNILSDVTFPMISGTSVARDFVELPSQLYEHWLSVPEILAKHAVHETTGEPLPQDLMERLLKAENFDQGFSTVEYLASALVDLDFHEGAAPADPMQRQEKVLQEIGMPAAIPMRHGTPQFAHIFSGDGYAAGYYSYMWSEVMDADAFAAFSEVDDPFEPELADKLASEILSRGGADEPEELYLAFRGRMPGVDALLKGRGLADPQSHGAKS